MVASQRCCISIAIGKWQGFTQRVPPEVNVSYTHCDHWKWHKAKPTLLYCRFLHQTVGSAGAAAGPEPGSVAGSKAERGCGTHRKLDMKNVKNKTKQNTKIKRTINISSPETTDDKVVAILSVSAEIHLHALSYKSILLLDSTSDFMINLIQKDRPIAAAHLNRLSKTYRTCQKYSLTNSLCEEPFPVTIQEMNAFDVTGNQSAFFSEADQFAPSGCREGSHGSCLGSSLSQIFLALNRNPLR